MEVKTKNAIDEAIKTANSYEDFLLQMQVYGYEIKQGKHISFRAEDQQRFTRSKSLGWYYDEEHIRSRIDRRLEWCDAEERKAHQANKNPYISDNYIGRLINLENSNIQKSEGLKRWAMLQNMQNASKLINFLTEKNITDNKSLDDRIVALYDTQLDIADSIKLTEKEIALVSKQIDILQNYHKFKEINLQYKFSENPDDYYRKYEFELRSYALAKENVKELLVNGKLPNLKALQIHLEEVRTEKEKLMNYYQSVREEIKEINKVREQLRQFSDNQRKRGRDGDIT